MPHIQIKAHPKGLSAKQLPQFTDKLTAQVSQEFSSTPADDIRIDYQEMAAENGKSDVWDKEIQPQRQQWLKQSNDEV